MTELEKLDPEEILRTARKLRARISERFPSAGLLGVADQLVELASRARATCRELAKPNWKLRVAVATVVALLVVASIAAAVIGLTSAEAGRSITWAELVQVAEAGANDLVLLGAAIYFFVSFETRFKRGKVVKALHQLRTLAHLIDAHQLTKTPEVIGHDELRTPSSPERRLTAFELGRYLDYCTEMLSLTGKIAALYGDGFDDAESLEAVNEIEEITVGLQGKIWQKLILLQAISPAVFGSHSTSLAPPAIAREPEAVTIAHGVDEPDERGADDSSAPLDESAEPAVVAGSADEDRREGKPAPAETVDAESAPETTESDE